MNNIFISIIILSKNAEDYIEDTLKKIFNQTIDKKYEVIIIDSGSYDSTLSIIKKYPINLVIIDSKDFGHGKTRNLGASMAKGEILVFLNADATPVDNYWLKNLVDNFKFNKEIAGVYSRIYPRDNCNPLRSWEILNDNYYFNRRVKKINSLKKYYRLRSEEKRKIISFHSISCAVERDIFFKYSFNKNLNFGEDLEWSKRVLESGFKIIYEDKSGVIHSHNFYYSFFKTFKKYFDDAKINNLLINRWKVINIHMLFLHILYKLLKDIYYVIKLNSSFIYKLKWILYSPIVRTAEFSGIFFASFIRLPSKVECYFSLADQIINE